MNKPVLTVCLNPTFQRTVVLEKLKSGEVNRAAAARLDASGKGINVSRVLHQLGVEAVHLTHLTSQHTEREAFLSLCRADNLNVVWEESPSQIRTCITLLDKEERSTTEIIEPTQPVDSSTAAAIRRSFSRELKKAGRVVLSGSRAPGYPDDLFAHFCMEAREAGVPVLADFRGEDLRKALEYGPEVIKINLVEFCATFLPESEVSEADDRDVLETVERELQKLSEGESSFVLTRGSREVLCARKGTVKRIPVEPVVPVNTIGSGDAFAAGTAWGLSLGSSLLDAVKKGIRCGADNARQLKPGSIKES